MNIYDTKIATELIGLCMMCKKWRDKSELANKMYEDIKAIYERYIEREEKR